MAKQSFNRIKDLVVLDGVLVLRVYKGKNLHDRYMTPVVAQQYLDSYMAQLPSMAKIDLEGAAAFQEILMEFKAKIDEALVWRASRNISPAEMLPVKKTMVTQEELKRLLDKQDSKELI